MKSLLRSFAAVLSLAALAVSQAPAAGAAGDAAAPAAAAAAGDLKAQQQFLQDQKLGGQAVLIEFGLVGCELSEAGLNAMIRLEQKKAVDGLSYLRVEAGRDPTAVDKYFAEKKPGFPVVRDPEAAVAKTFAATAVPRFVLVDRFGHVRYRGRFPDERLSEYMALLRAEKTDPGANTPLFGAVALDATLLLATTRLPDLHDAVKPLKDYQGKNGLMLMFVDTSCPFSAEAIQQVSSMAAKMGQQQVPTVLVNLEDAAERVKEFFAEKKTGTPVIYDVTTATKLKWGIDSVPTVVYVSAAGQIVYNGPAVWAKVAAAAEASMGLAGGTLVPKARGTEFG